MVTVPNSRPNSREFPNSELGPQVVVQDANYNVVGVIDATNQFGLNAQFRYTPYGQWQVADEGWSNATDLTWDPNDLTLNVFNVNGSSVG